MGVGGWWVGGRRGWEGGREGGADGSVMSESRAGVWAEELS
jgi:hypothetical protein